MLEGVQSALLTEEFKAKFQLELGDASKSPSVKFATLMCMLRDHKICYKQTYVPPKLLLVHKANRGELGLSPNNAHKNAAAIYSVGANKQKLGAAVAIALAPCGQPR